MKDKNVSAIREWIGSGALNIFGRPFAGKDTQAHFLKKLLDAPIIGGGDILRSHSEHAAVQQKVSGGKLAPSKEFLDIVLPYLGQAKFADQPLILNSVGRWFGEHTSVMEAAAAAGHPLKAVIFLNLSEADVTNRWGQTRQAGDRGKREDDAHGALPIRLDEFKQKTLPVLEFYKNAGLLIEINAAQTPDKVSADILNALTERAAV